MSLPAGTFSQTYADDMAIVRTRLQWGIMLVTIAFLFTLPAFLSSTFMNYVNLICISIVATLGLQILMGYCGQISMGQAAFMAVGAYTSAILTTRLELPFWLALPLAGLVTGIVGMIFGLPSLRVKGFYLAMATLAAQFIIPWLILNVRPDITMGTSSYVVPSPTIGDFKFNTQQTMYYIIFPITLLAVLVAKNLVRTRLGRAFIAIRDNDIAAAVMGVNVFKYKLIAFFLCSFYAGIAGSLYAHWMRAVSVDHFGFMESVWYLGMIIVGGMGSISGAVMGAIFIRILDTISRELTPLVGSFSVLAMSAIAPLFFGIVIIVFLIFEPRGLYHRWMLFKTSYRLWPFSY